jgi:hypothetical protein
MGNTAIANQQPSRIHPPFPEALQDIAASSRRSRGQRAKLTAAVVGNDERRERPRHSSFSAAEIGRAAALAASYASMNSGDQGRPGNGTGLKPSRRNSHRSLPCLSIQQWVYGGFFTQRPQSHCALYADCHLPHAPTTTTILPVLSTSTLATGTPAAATPLTALVTSRCRKMQGRRLIGPAPVEAPGFQVAQGLLRSPPPSRSWRQRPAFRHG